MVGQRSRTEVGIGLRDELGLPCEPQHVLRGVAGRKPLLTGVPSRRPVHDELRSSRLSVIAGLLRLGWTFWLWVVGWVPLMYRQYVLNQLAQDRLSKLGGEAKLLNLSTDDSATLLAEKMEG